MLIAQSDNSQDETADAGLLYQTDAIPAGDVNPLQKLNDRYQPHHASGLPKDIWGTNSLDAGMRVVLPGGKASAVRTCSGSAAAIWRPATPRTSCWTRSSSTAA